MADNVTLPALGSVVATDEVSGRHYQFIKLVDGAADSATPLQITAGGAAKVEVQGALSVTVASLPNVTVANTPTVVDAALAVLTNVLIDMVGLLKRLAKQQESLGTVDGQQRLRIAVDAGTLPAVTTVTTVATVTSLATIAGVDPRYQMIDWAREAYNSGIRGKLSFS